MSLMKKTTTTTNGSTTAMDWEITTKRVGPIVIGDLWYVGNEEKGRQHVYSTWARTKEMVERELRDTIVEEEARARALEAEAGTP